MNIGEVTYSIEVNTSGLDKAERKMDEARKSSDQLGDSLDKSGRSAKTAKDKFTGAGTAADKLGKDSKRATDKIKTGFTGAKSAVNAFVGVLVGLGIVRGFTSIIRATNQFNASISELSAITGATGRDLEFYARQSREIGRSTTLSASQAATAFKLIASAKPDLLDNAEALSAVTKEAVTLAEAARLDLPTAANALGNALNQFQAGADQANRFINVLAAGSKLGASAISDTSMALKNVGAVASSVGLSFEETNAAIQALAAGGLKAAEAGTGLRGVLLKLEKSGNDAITPSVVGMSEAISNLRDMGLSTVEMMDLFGLESITAANTLIAQADSVDKLIAALTGTNIAAEQAATNFDNLSGDVLAMKSATEGLQIALGDTLTPALRNVTQGTTDLLNAITEFIQTGDGPFTATLRNLSIALTALFVMIKAQGIVNLASFVISLNTTSAAMTALTTSTVAFRGALAFLTGPAGLLAMASAGVAALALAYLNLKDAQDAAIGNATSTIVRGGLENVEMGIAGARSEIERLKGVIQENNGPFSHFIGSEANRARDQIKNLEQLIRELTVEQERLTREQERNERQMESAAASIGVLRNQTQQVKSDFNLLGDELVGFSDLTGLAETAAKNFGFRMEGVTDVVGYSTQKYVEANRVGSEIIKTLEQQKEQIGMTGRAQAIYNAVMDATSKGVLPEQIAKIAELTAEMYDQAEAATEAANRRAESERATAEANRQAQEAMREQWNQTRDSFANFFVDLIDNGTNAFDSLLKSFEHMIKQMVAQWLASGLMNLLGMGGGGPTQTGGFSLLGGGTGAGVSSILGSGGGGGAIGMAQSVLGSSGIGGFAEGLFGFGQGASGFMGPMSKAATMGSKLASFATGPVGIGLAALAAGKMIHDKTSDPDDYKRIMGGMLVAPTAGAPMADQFAVQAFASGFRPTGFAEGSQADAEKIINQFRFVDQAIVDAVGKIGGATINLANATLGGFGVEGTGTGTFMGRTQRTTEAQFAEQINSFAIQLGKHIHGLEADEMAQLKQASTAQDLIYTLTSFADETVESQDTTQDNTTSTDDNTRATDANSDLITHLDNSNELLFNSNGDLVNSNGAVIASQERVATLLNDMPASLQAAVNRFEQRTANRATAISQETGRPSGAQRVLSSMVTDEFVEQKRRERVQRNLMKAEYGYSAVTGKWDESMGGFSAYWNAQQTAGLNLGAATPNTGPISLDGSHADGLDRVPRDGYIAELHQGERVLTSSEADAMDSGMGAGAGGGGGGFSLIEIASTILTNSTRVASIIRRWDRDGIPEQRTS